MTRKCLSAFVAGTLSLAPSAAYAEALPGPYFIELSQVKLLVCDGSRGSGVVIDTNLVLTADHVVAGRTCTIDGMPVEIVHEDGALDIAVVKTASSEPSRMVTNCGGFVKGSYYLAIGYAQGRDFVVLRLKASGDRMTKGSEFPNMPILKGNPTYPGMSGGAVINEEGELVGIVNAGDRQSRLLSRSLAETYICS